MSADSRIELYSVVLSFLVLAIFMFYLDCKGARRKKS